ncbi:hypothetical protein JTB14_014212 [Gonioctena quinquepunctata]|nr:hypothetical protein JTB14_014212 [Gonioctena quinquepunctata]
MADDFEMVSSSENYEAEMSEMNNALSDLKNSSPGPYNITYARINNMTLDAKLQLSKKMEGTIVIPLLKESEEPTSTSFFFNTQISANPANPTITKDLLIHRKWKRNPLVIITHHKEI